VISDDFVEAIEKRRAELGWTKQRLADEMGVGISYVGDYINGRRKPGPEVVERFAKALGMQARIVFEPLSMKKVPQSA